MNSHFELLWLSQQLFAHENPLGQPTLGVCPGLGFPWSNRLLFAPFGICTSTWQAGAVTKSIHAMKWDTWGFDSASFTGIDTIKKNVPKSFHAPLMQICLYYTTWLWARSRRHHVFFPHQSYAPATFHIVANLTRAIHAISNMEQSPTRKLSLLASRHQKDLGGFRASFGFGLALSNLSRGSSFQHARRRCLKGCSQVFEKVGKRLTSNTLKCPLNVWKYWEMIDR